MIKLVAVDLDGTLLPENQIVPDATKRIIRNVVSRGIYFVLASGRCFKSARHIQEDLGIIGQPLILHNGVIVKLKSGKPKILNTIPAESVEKFYKSSMRKKWNANFIFGDCDMVYTNSEYEYGRFVMREYNFTNPVYVNDFEEIKKYCNEIEAPNKILVTTGSMDETNRIYNEINNEFNTEVTVLKAGERFIDIAPQGTTKAVGLKQLIDELDIKEDEIMTIGDGENDLTMLDLAGFPIAMGNSLKNVKKKAIYITDSNENEGVRKVIELFILGEENVGNKL